MGDALMGDALIGTRLSADREALTLNAAPDVKSVDVLFDGHRVWSIDLRASSGSTNLASTHPWPAALRPYLNGCTALTVVDSSSKATLARAEIDFGEHATDHSSAPSSDPSTSPARVSVTNASGTWLSINKWGRLAPSLEEIGAKIHNRILEKTTEITRVLEELGQRPFIVGGTLLGAVREGRLLPHDDDADVAYLSQHTNPADVAVEGYEVGRALTARGYKLMRHSATHMQLHFKDEATGADYYVDVFAAFFTDDGHINQPFHVRGLMAREQMLPFGEVTVSDGAGGEFRFATPRDTDHWLTLNYDADWRTPVPGFVIETPDETNRRFLNWFGSFNYQRHFWNELYGDASRLTELSRLWQPGHDFIARQASNLEAPLLLELGAGDGALGARLQCTSREVVASDFADAPLELARERRLRTVHLNLYRLNVIVVRNLIGTGGAFDVVASHVLEQVGHEAREGAYRVFRVALLAGGSAVATFFSRPDPNVHPEDPTLWHLSPHALAIEAARLGLGVKFEAIETQDPAVAARKPVGVIFNLTPELNENISEDLSMKQRIAKLLASFKPGRSAREIAELREQVARLERDLDEQRELASRVAQLTDMVAERLDQSR